MNSVLITDDCHPLLIAGLERTGYRCVFEPSITLEETKRVIGGYEGLIVNSKILVDDRFLDSAPLLKFIGRMGSGMEIIDRAAAAKRGIAVFSSPEGNNNAVAEHAMGMLLGLLNRLAAADAEVRKGIWRREDNRGVELEGKTMGIIGFGHTGSRLARKLQGWDVQVLAHDKYKSGFAESMPWVRECAVPEIQAEADIISLHLPLTPETRHYADAAFLEACKPGVILVNTARGACVDTEALVRLLERGHVGGACLDVFENEKPETFTPEEKALYDKLYGLAHVQLSPHIAGWTHESKRKLAEQLLERIVTWRTSFASAVQ